MLKTLVLFLLLSGLLLSCQGVTLNVFFLDVKMLGVSETPEGAGGSADPISESFTVQKITALDDEKKEYVLLEEEKEVKIVNRTLLIFQKEVPSEFKGKTFTQFKVTFSTAAKATSRFTQDADLTLDLTEASYDDTFSVASGHGLTFVIKVKWKNTVTRDEDAETDQISSPAFEISFSRS
ncbi:MAG: hypothetical protein HYW48_00185 [Deltaproteobacteria bacterium]|nr:hypothetical protein [Deltaproteobacteria bacterium]